MTIGTLVFGVAFIVALGSAIAMLFARNAVHVALFLVAAQVALALTFLLQGAFFVAAVQIIIYAGAIMVLFLFVVMLLGVDRSEALVEPLPFQRPLALGLGALLAAGILYLAVAGIDAASTITGDGSGALLALNRDPGNVLALARVLFSRYLLPFEATSALLVAAIVGVMVLARRVGSISAVAPRISPAEEREVA
ncbi:MAG: NADH-quinone oxidoreductase subunit J [Actinobacteria bacterium]|nr:NADH-quinone oxidoreductase subunit J [Actinomycetota bacterium]